MKRGRVIQEGESRIGLQPQTADNTDPSLEITFTHMDRQMAMLGLAELLQAVGTQYNNDMQKDGNASAQLWQSHLYLAERLYVVGRPRVEAATHYRLGLAVAGAALGMLLSVMLVKGKFSDSGWRETGQP